MLSINQSACQMHMTSTALKHIMPCLQVGYSTFRSIKQFPQTSSPPSPPGPLLSPCARPSSRLNSLHLGIACGECTHDFYRGRSVAYQPSEEARDRCTSCWQHRHAPSRLGVLPPLFLWKFLVSLLNRAAEPDDWHGNLHRSAVSCTIQSCSGEAGTCKRHTRPHIHSLDSDDSNPLASTRLR